MHFYAEKLKKYKKLLDEVKDLSNEKDSDVEFYLGKGLENDDQETLSPDGEVNSQTTSRELQETKIDGEQPPTQLSEKASLLLGVAKRQLNDQYFNFHPESAACWNEILNSRLDAKIKKSFEETYPNKGNCSLIAPELNPELLLFLHKTAKSWDKYLVSSQELYGRSFVALGKFICTIFNDEKEPLEKDLLLDWLCDSSQMFCELMHQLSKTHKHQVYSYVDDKRKTVLVDSKTDKFLFGEDLGKRIKSATMAEKVGLSLKTNPDKVDSSKSRNFLNWKSSTMTQNERQQLSFNQRTSNKFSRSNRVPVQQNPTRSSTRSQSRLNQFNNPSTK